MRALVAASGLFLAAESAAQEAPLSAIDWLSRSIEAPDQDTTATQDEAPAVRDASTPTVATRPLSDVSPDNIGLLRPEAAALPRDLWVGSDARHLAALISDHPDHVLPSLQELFRSLLLVSAHPPGGAAPVGTVFQARVDKLLDLGAIETAAALLEQAEIADAPLFRRWFDVALLRGTEQRACVVMQDRFDIAPTQAAQIFCLARLGDWRAAALTLNTYTALGDLAADEEKLLARFLDPDLFEGAPRPRHPDPVTPLSFRMFEAISAPMNTQALPRAFAHTDLHDTRGWKTQLEAAERLTRAGALPPNVLFALYAAGTPSASGGVWDRAAAMIALEAALAAGDHGAVSQALPNAWQAARAAGVPAAFASEYGRALQAFTLPEPTASLVSRIKLISNNFASVSPTDSALAAQYAGVAQGQVNRAARTPQEAAVFAALTDAPPPAHLMVLAQNGQLGEALLLTLARFADRAQSDPRVVTETLAFLRAVGLEDQAIRTGLQYILIEELE